MVSTKVSMAIGVVLMISGASSQAMNGMGGMGGMSGMSGMPCHRDAAPLREI